MDRKVVALILYANHEVYDICWTWETGECFASDGWIVVAIADDGYMDVKRAQGLYDYRRECHDDCFGIATVPV